MKLRLANIGNCFLEQVCFGEIQSCAFLGIRVVLLAVPERAHEIGIQIVFHSFVAQTIALFAKMEYVWPTTTTAGCLTDRPHQTFEAQMNNLQLVFQKRKRPAQSSDTKQIELAGNSLDCD